MVPANAKKSSSISNLHEAHPHGRHQRSFSTGQNLYESDNVEIDPSMLESPASRPLNGFRHRSMCQRGIRPQFHIYDNDDDLYDGNAYYTGYSDEEEEERRSRKRGFQSDDANDRHSDVVQQLLKTIFHGFPPPEPRFVQGLRHNPPYFCFPTPVHDALLLPVLTSHSDGNRSRISSIVRSGIRQIFSPSRRKNSHLPTTKSRISTVSLPGGGLTYNNQNLIDHCNTDNDLQRYHRWSMVQPPNLMKITRLQGSDSVSRHSSPPNNAPLSSSQPEFTVPVPPPPPVLDEADQLPSDPPSATARGGTVEIGLLKRDITSLEKAIRKIESQLKKLDNWFFEQMAAESSAADRPPSSSTTASPSSEVSIKQTYKKRNSELKRQLTEMQTRLSDTRYVVHHLENHGLPEGVAAKIFIRRLLADRRKDERSAVGGESGRVSGSPKKSDKSRHASPHPTSTPPEAKHGKTRSASPPPAIPPNDRSVGVTNTGSSSSSGPPLTTVGMSPSRSFATLPASRPASITAENATAAVRARTLPSTSTATSLTTSSEAEAIAAAWAACKSAAPPALVDATNSAKATRIKPTPVSPSNSAAALLATATAMASNASSGVDSHYHPHYTPHQPHLLTDTASPPSHFVTSPSATGGHAHKQLPLFDHLGADLGSGTPGKMAKKPRTSMKSAFRFLGRPFRRSGNALPIQRSLSEEHIAGHSVLGDALLQSSDSLSGKLNKSPSTTNTRAIIPGRGSPSLPSALGLMTDPRGKKNRNHGNGATDQHSYPSHQDTPVQGKRSQAGSLSSAGAGGPSGSIHQAALIDPTTEGGSHRSGASIDNPALTRILEVLSGSFSQPPSCVGALPPLTSSGSSQSGRMPPLTVATGVASGGAAAGQSPSPVNIPGPATTLPTPVASVALNNVAAALVLLYHHCEALFDQRDLALQNLGEEVVGLRKGVKECRDAVNVAMAEIEALRRDIKTGEELQKQQLTNAISRLEQLDVSAEELRQNFRQDMAAIRKEQRRALEPLEYQLATKTRDLQDILTTLNNKFNIMEKSVEQLASPGRDQPRARQLFVHTLTDLGVSFFAFITALIQILIRFLNAGATVTQNRVSAIVLNISLLCVFLAVFLWEPVSRRWRNDT